MTNYRCTCWFHSVFESSRCSCSLPLNLDHHQANCWFSCFEFIYEAWVCLLFSSLDHFCKVFHLVSLLLLVTPSASRVLTFLLICIACHLCPLTVWFTDLENPKLHLNSIQVVRQTDNNQKIQITARHPQPGPCGLDQNRNEEKNGLLKWPGMHFHILVGGCFVSQL